MSSQNPDAYEKEFFDALKQKCAEEGKDVLQFAEDTIRSIVREEGKFRSYYDALLDRLGIISGKEGQEVRQFTDDVCRSVLGAPLDLEAYDSLDDQQAWDLLMRLEGVLVAVDLIASVFLVEKMKLASDSGGWNSIRLVDEVCRTLLDTAFDSETYVSLNADQTRKLLLRVDKAFALIRLLDQDPGPRDMMAVILACHRS